MYTYFSSNWCFLPIILIQFDWAIKGVLKYFLTACLSSHEYIEIFFLFVKVSKNDYIDY